MILLDHLNRFPPCLARMVARKQNGRGAKRLPLREIAERSGLSYGVVVRLSRQRSWDNVPIAVADKFMAACGIDPLHPKRKLWYLRRVMREPDGLRILAGGAPPRRTLAIIRSLATRAELTYGR